MNAVQKAVLLSWDLRPEVILVLITAGILYTRGWRHLRGSRQRAQGECLATGIRLASYWTGLVVLGLALMSPIDVLGGQFFFMHMIQHLLLVMVAPPLLWLASPLPFVMWGFPSPARRTVGGWLRPRSAFRRRVKALTPPGMVWMMFVAVLLGWHDPNAYQAALQDEMVHDLEHLSFFLTAMLFWWHVTNAAPHIHKPLVRGARIAFLLAAVPPNMAAGAVIAFSGAPIYAYYTGVPRPWGLTVMQDQMLGGIIMWIPGSMMYIIAALVLVSRWLQEEERKPPLPEEVWSGGDNMTAPGFDH